jgi:hypothetical protein
VCGERFIYAFGGQPKGKRLLVRCRRRWDDIKNRSSSSRMGVDWIDLAQVRDK